MNLTLIQELRSALGDSAVLIEGDIPERNGTGPPWRSVPR